jgi:hypothetical protein
MGGSCPCCGCGEPAGARAHQVHAALADDDLDRALTLGLLEDGVGCAACSEACRARLAGARDERLRALAARERFRARTARLERRDRERAARRKPVATPADAGTGAALPALPPAAAAALARAKARAAGRKP